jgi:hypothetical protein
MDLKEVRWEGSDWIHLAQDMDEYRVLTNTVIKRSDSIKREQFLDPPRNCRFLQRGSSLWSQSGCGLTF